MDDEPEAVKRPASLWLLAGFFGVAGVAHFLRPGPYIGIVPPWLPDAPLLVALSGVAEVAGGLGVLLPATRRAAGIGLILLLLAVFPANIEMLSAAISAGKPAWWQALLWMRLPFQPLLAWWIWRTCIRSHEHGAGRPRA